MTTPDREEYLEKRRKNKKLPRKARYKYTINDILNEAIDIHKEREKEYGEAWRIQGKIMKELLQQKRPNRKIPLTV